MTGRERVRRLFAGDSIDRPPILPIVHSSLASILGFTLSEFYSHEGVMADVMVRGYRRFGFDGVQLSMAVKGEVEALGTGVEQPVEMATLLKEYLLADVKNLEELRMRDPLIGGKMPSYFTAVRDVVREIEDDGFVLANLRGPMLAASQLRGLEQTLIDLVMTPHEFDAVLDFTSELVLTLGKWLLGTGAHGLVLGEAICSPNSISPALYREKVLPRHKALIQDLKRVGWPIVGLHICGDSTSIIEDIVATDADFMDIDHRVNAALALSLTEGKMVLRGNLDPTTVFRLARPEEVRRKTRELCQNVGKGRWIMSSGCDIPPGTPAENIAAFAETVREC